MTSCETCGAEYSSPLGAAECEEQDRLDDLHARQELRGRSR